jgi:hypothetical protein
LDRLAAAAGYVPAPRNLRMPPAAHKGNSVIARRPQNDEAIQQRHLLRWIASLRSR